tara:strand:+ start:82 stop:735 length:654 start_codon:yes stop_codon:yes gene_type:complete
MTEHAIIEKINQIAGYPTMNDWSRDFCESITEQIEKGRKLSDKQMDVLTRIFNENTEEEVQKLERWSDDFELKYSSVAALLANYYKTTPYYRDVVNDILGGKVPNRRSFFKMLNNKFAHKVIEEAERPAKFRINDYVLGNAKCSHDHLEAVDSGRLGRHIYNDFRLRGGFIVGISSMIKSHARGAKRYKILPLGSTVSFWVEERHIKKAPKPKKPTS